MLETLSFSKKLAHHIGAIKYSFPTIIWRKREHYLCSTTHEHVGTNAAGLRHTYPEFLDREGLLEQAVAAIHEAYQAGVRTMVEMSTFDLGRDIGLMQEVSRRSGVQLIAVTGSHLAVPRPFGEVSPDVVVRVYSKEIEAGIEGTGIKAGLVKAASDRGGISAAAGGGPAREGS